MNREYDCKRDQNKFKGDGKCLKLDGSDRYTCLQVYVKHHLTLKIVTLTPYKIYFNKAEKKN